MLPTKMLWSPPKKTEGYHDVKASSVIVDSDDNSKCSKQCPYVKAGWCSDFYCGNKNIMHRQSKIKLVGMNRTAACLDCYRGWGK